MPRPRAHTCSPVYGFRRTRACQANKSFQRLRQEQVQIPRWSRHKQASNSVGELSVSHVRGEVLQMLEFAFLLVRISGSHFRKDPTVSLVCRWRRAEFRPSQSPKASRVQLSSTLSYSTSNEEFAPRTTQDIDLVGVTAIFFCCFLEIHPLSGRQRTSESHLDRAALAARGIRLCALQLIGKRN